MRKTTIPVGLAILLLCSFAFSQDQPGAKRGPSTPEERKRFVAIVHQLEKTPLDPSLSSDVAWALQWLEDIPDITVTICWAPLGHFGMEQYPYDSRIRGQFVLGMGAALIEHQPRQADAIYLAGVESALRTYRSILKSKPEARSEVLDDLLAKRDDGTLRDFVHDASKACEGNESMARNTPNLR